MNHEVKSMKPERVWLGDERRYEQFGAERWEISWEAVKPAAMARRAEIEASGGTDDIDPDQDIDYCSLTFKTKAAAMDKARQLVAGFQTAYGQVSVTKQRVDWFVESDRVAEWTDVGELIHVD